MEEFASALRQLLQERGLKQAAFARRIGVTPQAVSSWVTGSSTPSRARVQLIEDELAVDPRGYLMTLAGWSTDGDPAAATVESLLRADPGLDPEDKRVLLRIIRIARERFATEAD